MSVISNQIHPPGILKNYFEDLVAEQLRRTNLHRSFVLNLWMFFDGRKFSEWHVEWHLQKASRNISSERKYHAERRSWHRMDFDTFEKLKPRKRTNHVMMTEWSNILEDSFTCANIISYQIFRHDSRLKYDRRKNRKRDKNQSRRSLSSEFHIPTYPWQS